MSAFARLMVLDNRPGSEKSYLGGGTSREMLYDIWTDVEDTIRKWRQKPEEERQASETSDITPPNVRGYIATARAFGQMRNFFVTDIWLAQPHLLFEKLSKSRPEMQQKRLIQEEKLGRRNSGKLLRSATFMC